MAARRRRLRRAGPLDVSSTSSADLRVAAVIESTSAEGPDHRFAVRSPRCALRCDGCFNPHLWSTESGKVTGVEQLANRAAASGAQGVTLLGGEPFEQAPAFALFSRLVRAQGLSVMVFTGSRRAQLSSAGAPPGAVDLLAATDLLVDGPYLADSPDLVRPWVGSTNQEFHFLTDRYLYLQDELSELPDRVEIRVAPTGEVQLNGWATIDQLDALLAGEVAPLRRGRVR